MQTATSAIDTDRDGDQYHGFLASLRENFTKAVDLNHTPLFTTDAHDLFDLFLSQLPEEAQQHYKCRACKNFVNKYGGLVHIDSKGRKTPVMWEWPDVPDFFKPAALALYDTVRLAQVTGVFVSSETVYGQPVTGPWHHMSVEPRNWMIWRSRTQSASQRQAELAQDYNMLTNALGKYSRDTVNTALTLLKSEALYRGDKVLGVAEWFSKVLDMRQAVKTVGHKANVIWLAVATAPAGYAHVSSSMIGTLLDDIAAGLPLDDAKARFAAKMNPAQYQRAQVAPSAGNIAQAEKLVEKLGLANSLKRRYARLAEIPEFIWKPRATKQQPTGGVFGHLTPKAEATTEEREFTGQTMTWEKFARTILPRAITIEALIPSAADRFAALVTAADQDAEPILQWDKVESRNPFSWYYHAGIDGEMKRRVEAAGGKYEGVDIRATLAWDTRDDLDLYCVTPQRQQIWYNEKRSSCGGWLDVDANAACRNTTLAPVENIRWEAGKAKPGRYQFFAKTYQFYNNPGPIAFRVEIKVGDQVLSFSETISKNGYEGEASTFRILTIDYQPGQPIKIVSQGADLLAANNRQWNVNPGEWRKVTAVVASPNQWNKGMFAAAGLHTFFLLEGCRDLSQGMGRGFFTETLRSDLREVRSTLEAYNASAAIEGAEYADACGLGYSNQAPWELVLKVTTENTSATYKIDRWD
jgi:hypothetical protein